ncbi:protein disulfide isomerase-like 1-6 isoform X2 [Tripterygium wilfordii]|uniref:protein disulfide-isomerase n=1 Tax=Tripterygium wilfordii TaxID=458696 RepID=A0A7J7D5N5_TRIWF|nr:protein disulfide isomerase-like 1-6 [Tripterygium wilfordii]KAF5741675.1 protein disulfide isomerase-like 1-6 isoform X2 [Tripterygium wilfordii]
MFTTKPSSRFTWVTLSLFLLLTFCITTIATEPTSTDIGNEDSEDDLQELLAIDEEEELKQQGEVSKERLSEAEVLSKAQRIVFELNSDSVKRVIDENEFVMVLGYTPWDARSAELMPQFAEAANQLKELGIPLLMAKVDCERYPKVASMLNIKGFPTLLLFVNGTSQAYSGGGFTAEDLVIWARKKTGVPVIRINSVTEAESFLKKHPMFVVGLFKKYEGPDYEEYVKSAAADNEIQFVETSAGNVAKVLFPEIKDTKPFLGIVKSEPERYTSYEGSFEKDNILQFLDHNKFPLVTKLNEMNYARIYSSPVKLQVFVFAEADELKKLFEPFLDVARKFKSKIMFMYIDIQDENLAKPFLTLFGLEETEDTVVTAFDNKMSSKFLLESDPTPNNIEEFCSGLLRGTLSPFFKSQPIPDNKEASVQIVVGKTFDNLVLDSPMDVLLEVHTPWCINCETTSKQIEKLAKHFKGLDTLMFARIDASANEHPKLQVDNYPTLLYYPASDKENPIKLSTKTSSKDLAAFINKQLKAKDQGTKDEL